MRIANLSSELNDERSLEEIISARLKISVKKIRGVKIIRKAIDARRYKGSAIKFNYIVDVELDGGINFHDKNIKKISSSENKTLKIPRLPKVLNSPRPVVVGFGPAGMFAALTLAKAGYEPIIFERGGNVDERTAAVEKFFHGGELNENSNIQFGEGGAGTFSDGKLTTRLNDDLIFSVLKIFVEAGAPEEILYLQKPHIGTDKLRGVVKNIRQQIIELGGKIFFNSQVTDFEFDSDKKISAVIVNGEEKFSTDAVFFAVGHSARDTYEMLNRHKISMETKSFAVGLRIEHPQEFINHAQYGEDFKNTKLPAADYMLTYKDLKNNRGAYSFCMCPGGQVVAATSENFQVVTNGMSNFARNSGTANSAILVTVNAKDFEKDFGGDVLSGVRFQRHYEKLAFELGGKNFSAPVQTVGDFLNNRAESKNFLTKPTYPVGFKIADLNKCLPAEVSATLKDALIFWDGKIKNFAAADVILTGVETRTSSPCRIIRDKENFQSISHAGIFPIGEGAGYSGGIMSSAIDGIKAVKNFIGDF
ncbi:MAG: FAD-dependent oxidoreductase [Selenomonadaceae bacterium]|nr:FAD-dependent oxidoreductase [Selenomonadaceae bacterium]